MFVNDIAELVPSFDTKEQQECLHGDLARLGAEETARQFGQAEKILDAYMDAAESIRNVALYVTLAEAKARASEGKVRAAADAS